MIIKTLMKINIAAFVILLLFTSLIAVVWAESTVDIEVKNKVNTSQNSTSNTTSNTTVNSNSTNTSKVTNHIEVEINGEKRVIDDTQEGSNINSNIKVEGKSVNGQTTFNISGNPDSVKSETAPENQTTSSNSASEKQTSQPEEKIEKKDLVTMVVDFFKGVVDFITFWS